jgi:hypothetical protein
MKVICGVGWGPMEPGVGRGENHDMRTHSLRSFLTAAGRLALLGSGLGEDLQL